MVRNYRQGPAWTQGTVFKHLGSVTFLVHVNGQVWKHYVDQIKKLGTDKLPTEFENTDLGCFVATAISTTSENTPVYLRNHNMLGC